MLFNGVKLVGGKTFLIIGVTPKDTPEVIPIYPKAFEPYPNPFDNELKYL